MRCPAPRSTLCLLLTTLLAACTGGAVQARSDDPAPAAGPIDALCSPDATGLVGAAWVGGAALLCTLGEGYGSEQKPTACWEVRGDGAVASASPVDWPPPGEGLAQRYEGPVEVTRADGRLRGVYDPFQHVTFLDDRGAQVARVVADDTEHGPSASVYEALMVGDTLLLVDTDAGPHQDVHAFAVDGGYLGEVVDEVNGGAWSVLDAHRVAFTGPGLASLSIFDARTHATTHHRRRVPALSACPEPEATLADYLLEPIHVCGAEAYTPLPPACCAELEARYGRYFNAEVVALDDGALLIATRRPGGIDLAVLDPETGVIVREPSGRCAAE